MRCASPETDDAQPTLAALRRSPHFPLATIALLGSALAFGAVGTHAQDGKKPIADSPARVRTLIWSDEFNGPDGSMPDPAKWNVVANGSGYGNREL